MVLILSSFVSPKIAEELLPARLITSSGTHIFEAEYTILEILDAFTNEVRPIRVRSRDSQTFSFISIF